MERPFNESGSKNIGSRRTVAPAVNAENLLRELRGLEELGKRAMTDDTEGITIPSGARFRDIRNGYRK